MVTIDDIKLVKDFLGKRGIDFILTGTAGLNIHGLVPENYEVGDIDIIVIVSEPTNEMFRSVLQDLENLTGGNNIAKENYTHECYTFFVGPNRTKVNAILHPLDKEPLPTYIELTFGKKTLKLHAVNEILKAKFYLRRIKDYKFCNDLIKTIASYV